MYSYSNFVLVYSNTIENIECIKTKLLGSFRILKDGKFHTNLYNDYHLTFYFNTFTDNHLKTKQNLALVLCLFYQNPLSIFWDHLISISYNAIYDNVVVIKLNWV